jgi:hypothetical protein
MLKTKITYAKAEGRDWRLEIPEVSRMAFDYHHSPYGCKGKGSMGACESARCVTRSLEQVEAIIEHAGVLSALIEFSR